MSYAATSPRVLGDTFRISQVHDIVLVASATLFIAVMAQVSIPLPFTPVPLTGQTLAVLLSAAALGAWRAVASTSLYLALALVGLPVLAPKADGSHVTGTAVFSMASLGYVLGFIVAGAIVGNLAERGFSKTPARTALAMVLGNLVIYSIGLPVLQSVTGADFATAMSWGVTPFLAGDLLKVVIAAGLLPAAWRIANR
jgi:biotin transport system substrate-specific component